MFASGAVAEFYQARGWQADGGAASVQAPAEAEPVERPQKRTTRRRKADNGVDAA